MQTSGGTVRLLPLDVSDLDIERVCPRTLGSLAPCPWASCRNNLYLDDGPRGGLKLNFPDRDVDELRETCAVDVALNGALTLEEVGVLMNGTAKRHRFQPGGR